MEKLYISNYSLPYSFPGSYFLVCSQTSDFLSKVQYWCLSFLKFTLLITNHVFNLRPFFHPFSQGFFTCLLTSKWDILTYVHLLHVLYWLILLPVLPRAERIWLYSREIQFLWYFWGWFQHRGILCKLRPERGLHCEYNENGSIRFKSSEITEINHILHKFSGFPFFTTEICIFAVLCKGTDLDQGSEQGKDENNYWAL